MTKHKDSEKTVKRILDVATKLFIEHGYEKTSMNMIIEGLDGLSKGAIYHHFKSKEELFDRLTDAVFYRTIDELDKDTNTDTALVKLQKILYAVNSDKDMQKLNASTMHVLTDPKFLQKFLLQNQQLAKDLQALVEEGASDGSIKTDNPKFLTELILLLGNLWFLPSVFPIAKGEFYSKVLFLKDVFEKLGVNIVNDEMLEVYKEYAKEFER